MAAQLLPLIVLGAFLGASSGAPRLTFGPSTHLETKTPATRAKVAEQISRFVLDPAGQKEWEQTRARVLASKGTLHMQMGFAFMNASQLVQFANGTRQLGLQLSLETGGPMCGDGSGAKASVQVAKGLAPFTSANGTVAYIALESVFSRTHNECPDQPHAQTARELASYAKHLASIFAGTQFFLYDALPHYAVKDWPPNSPGGPKQQFGLDLESVLTTLKAAMDAEKVPLAGFWMDCPFEFSRDYPNSTSPMPTGSGFKKVAAAVELVKSLNLQVGKTFNSADGGANSDKLFCSNTLYDFGNVTALVPASAFDFIVVESWYMHPLQAVPETQAYTTANTALAVMNKAAAAPRTR